MDTTPKPRRKRSRTDLVHLHSLPSIQPATKIGQVTWIWPEIEAGLAAGMKLKEVWEAASRDGLELSYAQFRVYTSRLRRRRESSKVAETQPPPTTGKEASPQADVPAPDPFRNLRQQREKKKAIFDYDPFSVNKGLIE